MRSGPLIAPAAAVVVVLAGCSSTTRDAWTGRGRTVPVANEPTPTPATGGVVDGLGGLRTTLEARVVATGGVVRPVASECDTVVIAPSFTCRITYLGQTVSYQVTTRQASANGYNWQARADSMVATRAGIETAMWREYAARATAIRCDSSLPDQQRVAPGAKLRQRCYFTPTSNDRAFGKGTGNHGRTVGVDVTIYDGSIGLDEKIQ